MSKWSGVGAIAFAMLTSLVMVQPVVAQDDGDDAARIIRKCVRELETRSKRVAEANGNTAKATARLVRRLLNAGQEERAKRVARRGINVIKERSRKAQANLSKLCKRCAKAAREAGATEEQMAILKRACAAAKKRVHVSAERGIKLILSQFDGGDGGDGN